MSSTRSGWRHATNHQRCDFSGALGSRGGAAAPPIEKTTAPNRAVAGSLRRRPIRTTAKDDRIPRAIGNVIRGLT